MAKGRVWTNVLKGVLAAVALVAIVSLPARQLAPGLSLTELSLLIAIALVVITALAVVSLQVAQFILRKGGTDVQWFWFGSDPPGLERAER